MLNVDSYNKVTDFVNLINFHSLLLVIHNPATLLDNIFVNKLIPMVSANLCIEISNHLPNFTLINYLHDASILKSSTSKLNYAKIATNLSSQERDFISDIADVNCDFNHFFNIIRK